MIYNKTGRHDIVCGRCLKPLGKMWFRGFHGCGIRCGDKECNSWKGKIPTPFSMITSEYIQFLKNRAQCDCGGEKIKSTHSDWCWVSKTEDFIKKITEWEKDHYKEKKIKQDW